MGREGVTQSVGSQQELLHNPAPGRACRIHRDESDFRCVVHRGSSGTLAPGPDCSVTIYSSHAADMPEEETEFKAELSAVCRGLPTPDWGPRGCPVWLAEPAVLGFCRNSPSVGKWRAEGVTAAPVAEQVPLLPLACAVGSEAQPS